MKIYINNYETNESTIKTKEKLIKTSKKLKIKIVQKPKEADIICSLGGDGTFLESSKIAQGIPIIGINCGTLGYLTDVKPKDIEKALKEIQDKKYYIEERMMLEGEIIKQNGETIKIPPSLNEIAISKNTFGVIRFDTLIDEKQINSYTADGILVCTPTGSTAYNLSCGGPIVHPTANILTLTPIAPHTVINRSIVLSDKSTIKIKITELKDNTTSYVLYDGHPIEVKTGDIVKIKKSKNITKIIKLHWQSFIDTIRNNIN